MSERYDESDLERFREQTLNLPYHRFCGLRLIHQAPGEATCRFEVDEHTAGGGGYLHGGILYGLLDVCAYFAVIPMLGPGYWAMSHDVHFALLGPAYGGATVELRAKVDRKGRRIAFTRVEAWRVGADSEELIATGTVTKSIVLSERVKRAPLGSATAAR